MQRTASKHPVVLFIFALALTFSACQEEVLFFCQLEAFFAGDPVALQECSTSIVGSQRVFSFFTEGEGGVDIFGVELTEGLSQEISGTGIAASFNMGNETYSALSGDLTITDLDEAENVISGEVSFLMTNGSTEEEFRLNFENVPFE